MLHTHLKFNLLSSFINFILTRYNKKRLLNVKENMCAMPPVEGGDECEYNVCFSTLYTLLHTPA